MNTFNEELKATISKVETLPPSPSKQDLLNELQRIERAMQARRDRHKRQDIAMFVVASIFVILVVARVFWR